jgi:hypothetical protein
MDDEPTKPDETDDTYSAPSFDWRLRLLPAIVAALLSPIVIDGMISAVAHSMHREPGVVVMVIVVSVEIAKFCLLATWLAWGGSRAVLRVIVVFISLLFTCVIFGVAGEPGATQFWSMLLLVQIFLACLIALPKLWGCRWFSAEELPLADPAAANSLGKRVRQFSLVDLFMWTATVAVVSGIVRWLGFPTDVLENNIGEFIFASLVLLYAVAVFAVGTLLSIWIAMSPSPRIKRRVTISSIGMTAAISPVLLMVMASAGRESGQIVLFLLATTALSMLLVAGPLAVLRSFGDRVVRIRRYNRPIQQTTEPAGPLGRQEPTQSAW